MPPPAVVSPSRLEQSCVDLLQTTLCLPACPEQLQLLCAAILRERSPWDSLSLSCDHIQNTRQLSLVASVLLAQVRQLLPPRLATPPLVALGPRQAVSWCAVPMGVGSAWVPFFHFRGCPWFQGKEPGPCAG